MFLFHVDFMFPKQRQTLIHEKWVYSKDKRCVKILIFYCLKCTNQSEFERSNYGHSVCYLAYVFQKLSNFFRKIVS